MAITSDLGWISGGYALGGTTTLEDVNYSTILSGTPANVGLTGTLNPYENPDPVFLKNQLEGSLPPGGLTYKDLSSIDGIKIPTAGGLVSLGQLINPTITDLTVGEVLDGYGNRGTFVGSDIKVLIEASNTNSIGTTTKVAKLLIELATMSISVHRETATARAFGYINPRGFAVGSRTIGGTLILTPFTVDVLFQFLQPGLISNFSKDTTTAKVDQLPPFDITIYFANEEGFASHRRLLGVKLITDGEVYSINDMMIERTISYMATDFTPLLPVTTNSILNNPDTNSPVSKSERMPVQDLFSKFNPGTNTVNV